MLDKEPITDALVAGDEVEDTEGLYFKVLAASPLEAVLELDPFLLSKDKDRLQFYTIDRNEYGHWVFRDDPTVYLTEVD